VQASQDNERLVIEVSAILLGTLFIAGGMLKSLSLTDPRVRVILVILYLASGSFSAAGLASWLSLSMPGGPQFKAIRRVGYGCFAGGWLLTGLSSTIHVLDIHLEEVLGITLFTIGLFGSIFLLGLSIGFIGLRLYPTIRRKRSDS